MPRIRECLIKEKTRHGKMRYLFHRRPDGRRMTIKGKPGELKFETEYKYLLNGGDLRKDQEIEAKRRLEQGLPPETLGELAKLYYRYIDREVSENRLASSTRDHYGYHIRKIAEGFASAVLADVKEHHLIQILEHYTTTSNSFNNMLRAVKHIFRFAKKHWGLKPNPAEDICKLPPKEEPHTPWSEEDIQKYFRHHRLGTTAHLAGLLLLDTGARVADLVKLGHHNLQMDDDTLLVVFKPQKSRRKKIKPTVYAPVSADLKKAIDLTSNNQPSFLVTERGESFSSKGFWSRMNSWIRAAGIESDISSHGMRHTLGIDIAHDDGNNFQIMSVLGHSSPRTAEIYTQEVSRRKLARQAAVKGVLRQRSLVS